MTTRAETPPPTRPGRKEEGRDETETLRPRDRETGHGLIFHLNGIE